MAELVGGKRVSGELVEAVEVEEGVLHHLHLVLLALNSLTKFTTTTTQS